MGRKDPNEIPSIGPTISDQTRVRVQLTVPQWLALICMVVSAAISVWSLHRDIVNRIDTMERARMESLKSRWSVDHQREWAHRLRGDNVGKITVPDPDTIRRDIFTQ